MYAIKKEEEEGEGGQKNIRKCRGSTKSHGSREKGNNKMKRKKKKIGVKRRSRASEPLYHKRVGCWGWFLSEQLQVICEKGLLEEK